MIHLVLPKTHEGTRGAGQWKDLRGIRQILNHLGADWREFDFYGGNISELIAAIGTAADVVIWYYSFWPEALERIKAECPRVRIVLRTVNAEALQHWSRAEKNWRRLRGMPCDVYGFLRLLWRDRRCARAADILAGISPWDDAHYWRRLAPRSAVRTAPYVSPWPQLLPEVKPQPWNRREKIIACVSASQNRIGRGHVAQFAQLAARPELASWQFVSTDMMNDRSETGLPENVYRLGHISEPWELLCRVQAVAVLSEVGFGFKTTISDALAAGTRVLVHPRQHARLPEEERQLANAVDAAAGIGIEKLVDALSRAPSYAPAQVQQRQADRGQRTWKDLLNHIGYAV